MARRIPHLIALAGLSLAVGLPASAIGAGAVAPRPVITSLKLSHTRFAVGTRATARVAAGRAAPPGTTFALHLNERATVLIAIAGKVDGHQSGARCVPGAGSGRACKVIVAPGVIIRKGRGPGPVSVPFSGRLGRKALVPGRYAAAIGAVDADGHQAAVHILRFTVVAR
jgi:hypothetical protein